MSDSLWPHDYMVHGILPNTGVGSPFPSPGDLPSPGIEPRSALQGDSLPAEPPGKYYMDLKIHIIVLKCEKAE